MAEYRRPRNGEELDDLLMDVKHMIHEDVELYDEDDDDFLPDDPLARLRTPSQDTRMWLDREDTIIVGASASADKAAQDYARYQPEYVDEPEPVQEPVQKQPSILAYNNDFADKGMQTTRRKKTQAQKAAQAQRLKEARKVQPVYEEEPYDADDGDDVPPPRRHRRRRGCGCGWITLIALVLIAVLVVGLVRMVGSIVDKGQDRLRQSGFSTILVAGTDLSDLRTDTLMLVTINENEKEYNILSIPRDTLVDAPYAVPKINGAYGYYGSGEAGMEAVMDLVEDCVGIRPDKYVLVNFTAVTELVDIMGGVEFNVPMDMSVSGVELKQGLQTLTGEQLLTLARFRDGYAMADLQRVQVQRELISAAVDQWLSLKNVSRIPEVIRSMKVNVLTDIDAFNVIAVALDLRGCKLGVTETLPGTAKMIGDGSYYVLDPEAVAAMVNEHFNPYEADITTEDLNIKVG